jgi:hypothetical protein
MCVRTFVWDVELLPYPVAWGIVAFNEWDVAQLAASVAEAIGPLDITLSQFFNQQVLRHRCISL